MVGGKSYEKENRRVYNNLNPDDLYNRDVSLLAGFWILTCIIEKNLLYYRKKCGGGGGNNYTTKNSGCFKNSGYYTSRARFAFGNKSASLKQKN